MRRGHRSEARVFAANPNLSNTFTPMLISLCPVDQRGPVCTPSYPGTGPASPLGLWWSRVGHAGQEAFDSFARPLETGSRNCEFAVTHGGPAWTPSDGSGASEQWVSDVTRGRCFQEQ